MLQYISKHLEVDIGIWTGDNNGHNLWEQSKLDGVNITATMSQMMKKYLPIKFISMLGNHDTYPFNQLDFSGTEYDYLKNGLADAWESWIGQDAADQFKKNSYYSYYDYTYGVRMLVINTQVPDCRSRAALSQPISSRIPLQTHTCTSTHINTHISTLTRTYEHAHTHI